MPHPLRIGRRGGAGRTQGFHQSADRGPRPDRWRAHGVSQTEVGDRHHRAPAHQHGPLRRRHRPDPVAGLRLGALCAARAAVIPIYRASQAAPCAEAREAKRQRTLAQRKAEAAASASSAAAPPAPALAPPQTLLGLGRGLLSWSKCPVPLTAVVNRERDEHGQTQDWVLVTTSERFTAAQIRSTYELRPAIEERHRQYKCFWDLTRMHSCAFSLVVNQALLVLLAYTLVQVHLVLRQRQELNRGVWEYTRQLLSPSLEVVAVYYRQRFCLLTLAEFGRILLDIPDPARAKLREKLKRIERQQYSLLENTRPP